MEGQRTEGAIKASVDAINARMGRVYIKSDLGTYFKLVVKANGNPKLDVEEVEGVPDDGIVCNEEA